MGDVLCICPESESDRGGMFKVGVLPAMRPPQLTLHSRWTNQRLAFGKKLNSLAVIRAKLAGMIERTESVYRFALHIHTIFPIFAFRCPKLARERHLSDV